MDREAIEKKLYDAATKGDLATFKEVVQEDPYLLDVVSFASSRNLLHISTMRGQVSIVEEVLKINPRLALDLDSKNSSSLHIAAAQGNVEIVEKLLAVGPEMCWWRDSNDMNPVHIAAMKGHGGALEKLLEQDSLPALERLYRGQTVLHLCVKHHQPETLKVLVEKLGEFVCAKDDDGETILHLAVRSNQFEIVRYLVEGHKIETLTTNSMDKTAMHILDESPPDTTTYAEIKSMLYGMSSQSMLEGLPKITDMTMVVVVLIATMAFQATVSPPGGVWQDNTLSHRAGEAVMASTHPKVYKHFSRANNIAFVSSLVTIILVITRAPLRHFTFLVIALYGTVVALTSIGVSYGASLMMTNPMETLSIGHIVAIVASFVVLVYVLNFVSRCTNELYLSWKRKVRQQQDLSNANLILRWIYHQFRIFQLAEYDANKVVFHRLLRLGSPARETVQAP